MRSRQARLAAFAVSAVISIVATSLLEPGEPITLMRSGELWWILIRVAALTMVVGVATLVLSLSFREFVRRHRAAFVMIALVAAIADVAACDIYRDVAMRAVLANGGRGRTGVDLATWVFVLPALLAALVAWTLSDHSIPPG